MSYPRLLSDSFAAKSSDNNQLTDSDEKNFATEIAEKNKEIRKQYRIVIEETISVEPTVQPVVKKKKT